MRRADQPDQFCRTGPGSALPSLDTPARPLAAPTQSPETFVECMLALTGLDVLRCPRCSEGRMVRVALELAINVAIEDTS